MQKAWDEAEIQMVMESTEIAAIAEEVRQFNLPKRHMKHTN